MMSFTITLSLVATMLIYAIPAFLLIKTKLAKESSIPGIAAILLYICTPSIIINAILQAKFNNDTLIDLLIFSALALVIQAIVFGGSYLILRRRFNDARARVASVASALGNYGFFGIPLLTGLMPNNPEAVVYTAIMSIFLNFIAFTFGSMLISGDAKYVSVKKLFLNPSVLPAIVAIPLFVANVRLPDQIMSILELFQTISTPLCMFVLGMRLATVKLSDVFGNPYSYFSVITKQLVMPLIALAFVHLLPCTPVMEQSLVIMCSCPIASVILNISEILENGQKHAVNVVLLGTILSIVTIPFIMLLY